MDRKLSVAVLVTALVVGIIGLLNVGLGMVAVKSGAFPGAAGRLHAPTIGVGSIIFGLVMLAAGALWVTSMAGYFTYKEWAPILALYVSPAIVAINLAGVLGFWGFHIHIGWAALSTVAGVGSICYLSRKELASFFLISVVEHVGVIVVFAILIYGEPVDVAKPMDGEMIVTIEEIKEQEEPLTLEIIPPERAVLDKTPTLPKMEIQNITTTEPGVKIESSAPQLPETLVQFQDEGSEAILKSPGRDRKEHLDQDTLPALDVDSSLDSSEKPSLEVGPSERTKGGTEGTVVRSPEYVRNPTPFSDERMGPSDEVARPSFVGDIEGEIAGRKVVFWPQQPEQYKGTKGGTVVIEFWVDPAGNVTKVNIRKKSGSSTLDRVAREYVERIRFAELPKNFRQKVQQGEISIDFKLTGGAGL